MGSFLLPAAVQGVLLAVQGVSYMLIQRFQGEFHDTARPVDQKIPLVTQTVYIYAAWYPLLFLYPLYLYSCSEAAWHLYILAIILDVACSLVIYLLYPTSFQRPELLPGSPSGKILSLLYVANYKGLNCMPSMHCSQCFIIFFSAMSSFFTGNMPIYTASFVCVLAVLIIISTVLTKQHVLIDVAAALPLAAGCFAAANLISLYFG